MLLEAGYIFMPVEPTLEEAQAKPPPLVLWKPPKGIAVVKTTKAGSFFVFLKAFLREGALTIFPFKRLFKGKLGKL